ncbi:MAG: alpha/beta fold hydrolase [Oxalobacteraceae bacterium]
MIIELKPHAAYAYTGGKTFDPRLPTAIFIHGAQSDHSVWALQTRYFAHHGFSVLALDLPGHGRSAGAPLRSVESLADWLTRVIHAADVHRAVLIGHSMGSLIALETASRARDTLCGVALVGTAYPMKVSEQLLEAAEHREQDAIDMVNIWSHAGIAQKPSAPGPGFYVPGGARRLMQHVSRGNPDKVFFTDFSACNNYANGEAAASALTCPAMLLLGRRDIMTPPKATAALRSAMPMAKIVQVEGSGHSLMAEQPDQVLDALFAFAAEAADAAK